MTFGMGISKDIWISKDRVFNLMSALYLLFFVICTKTRKKERNENYFLRSKY